MSVAGITNMTIGVKYTHASKLFTTGALEWTASVTYKLALLTSGYVPSLAHTAWANVSGFEVAAGDGYTAGGHALTSLSDDDQFLYAADLTIAALTKTFRYGVVYADGTFATIDRPLVGYILFDSTPADITITAEDFVVAWLDGAPFTNTQ